MYISYVTVTYVHIDHPSHIEDVQLHMTKPVIEPPEPSSGTSKERVVHQIKFDAKVGDVLHIVWNNGSWCNPSIVGIFRNDAGAQRCADQYRADNSCEYDDWPEPAVEKVTVQD